MIKLTSSYFSLLNAFYIRVFIEINEIKKISLIFIKYWVTNIYKKKTVLIHTIDTIGSRNNI
jgi:hypothetical protein